jgi:hypothetical protein
MKRSLFQIRFELHLLLALFVTGCVHSTEPGFSNPHLNNNNVTRNTGQSPHPEVEDSAIVVHIDPKTGEIITPPAGVLSGQVSQQPVDASKKPRAELRETLSPVPGGGVMIHLDDRFDSPLSATIDADGKVRFEHKENMSGSNDTK